MQQILMVFYVIFFSTGFMGSAALLLLSVRVRSRVLPVLLAFQLLFLLGIGLILGYFWAISNGLLSGAAERRALAGLMSINVFLWLLVVLIVRRVAPPTKRRWTPAVLAQVFAVLVAAKTVANVIVASVESSPIAEEAWLLGTHILVALGMASLGIVLRGPINAREPTAVHPLLNAYGTLSIVMAPLGLVEFALQSAGIAGLEQVSLDHVLYLAWNVVSMTAVITAFRPSGEGIFADGGVPEERIRELGLSAREVEMAVLIGQGLTNKEIAEKLFISPATVRTHIYNLYQKVGAGSRVELLNMLRG